MKKPSANSLRHIVAIETPTRVPDDLGGSKLIWSLLANVRADIISFKGTRLYMTERDEVHEPFRVLIRYRNDVTADMRIKWKGRLLSILSIHDIEGNRAWLTLDCEEGVA